MSATRRAILISIVGLAVLAAAPSMSQPLQTHRQRAPSAAVPGDAEDGAPITQPSRLPDMNGGDDSASQGASPTNAPHPDQSSDPARSDDQTGPGVVPPREQAPGPLDNPFLRFGIIGAIVVLAIVIGVSLYMLLIGRREDSEPHSDQTRSNDQRLYNEFEDLRRRVDMLERRLEAATQLPPHRSLSDLGATREAQAVGPKIVRPARAVSYDDARARTTEPGTISARDLELTNPSEPPPAQAPSVQEVVDAYNRLVGGYSPEAFDQFAAEFAAVGVEQEADGAFTLGRGDEVVWFIKAGGRGEGILVPGREAIRTWEKFYRALDGQRAKRVFGSIYDIDSGPALELATPALASASAVGYRVVSRGRLRG